MQCSNIQIYYYLTIKSLPVAQTTFYGGTKSIKKKANSSFRKTQFRTFFALYNNDSYSVQFITNNVSLICQTPTNYNISLDAIISIKINCLTAYLQQFSYSFWIFYKNTKVTTFTYSIQNVTINPHHSKTRLGIHKTTLTNTRNCCAIIFIITKCKFRSVLLTPASTAWRTKPCPPWLYDYSMYTTSHHPLTHLYTFPLCSCCCCCRAVSNNNNAENLRVGLGIRTGCELRIFRASRFVCFSFSQNA